MQTKLSFTTLLLLISFASVNAVLFTPALPDIAQYFKINTDRAQLTITCFLIGYAISQLLYGPLANRFGRKPTLIIGISLQIISCLLSLYAGIVKTYCLLVAARFLLVLGSGVGLKMTFTLVNECYLPKIASQTISQLLLAFAVTPGLAVMLGGILTTLYNWQSCFYACAIYGIILLIRVLRLPETQAKINYDALKMQHLLHSYTSQFSNKQLLIGGLLMGSSSCFVYIFAAVAPFIAINIFGIKNAAYGLANLLPSIGLVIGSLIGSKLTNKYTLKKLIKIGIWIACTGAALMLTTMLLHFPILIALFYR